nr:MAG TPA: DNA directed RNA polymerase subunit [Caudoviricetes sp.]
MSERDEKIISNLKLVNHILWKQFPNLAQSEDMFQIGCIGLIKAVDTFNEDANISFSTYASKCIMNEILIELRKQRKQVSEVSMETVILADTESEVTLNDILGGNEIDILDLDKFMKKLSPNEQTYFALRSKGYSKIQISKLMGVSRSYVTRLSQMMLAKYKRIYKVKE